jgi:hypothetical protein
MPDHINKKFEAKHLANIQKNQKKVKAIYQKTIDKVYKDMPPLKMKSGNFRISDYPEFNKKLDRVLLEFSEDVNVTLLNGIKEEWELSTQKNAEVIHTTYKGKKLADGVERMIYDPRSDALEQFTKRKTAGLGLSDRVWQYTDQFKSEIEQNLFAGLSEGKSAAAMARDQHKYLEMPDSIYKRVRDASVKTTMQKRELVLSPDAKRYKPGRGVYRSSYKNAMRLTRTIINDSYREADMVRYQTIPFILGYQVNLSNNHPRTDICDDLKGTYPKSFIWRKWHVQCMCNCKAKLASPEDYDKYEQALLNGTADNYQFKGVVKEVPDNFNTYVEKAKGSMDNWKRKPDWVTENSVTI